LTQRSDSADDSRAAVRHLGGQTAVVMGGTAFTFLVGLPFQVYLARGLGTAGLGTVGLAEAFVLTSAGLLSFGLAPLAVRYIPEYRATGASRSIRLLVMVGLAMLAGLGTLGAMILRPFAELLAEAVGITPESTALLDVLALLLPASMLSFFLAQSLRGFEEIRVVVLSTSVLALASKVMITVPLFIAFGASVRFYAWAMVLSQVVAILPMGWVLWRLLRGLPNEEVTAPVDWSAWRSFAGTNYASGLLNSIVGNLDRIVIGALLGPAAVGVFMVVRQLQHFPTVFHQVVLTVVSPVFARLKASGDVAGLAHQLHLANDWVMRMAAGLILLLLHAYRRAAGDEICADHEEP
jgi:O-antigen/teichoic acid export membrane protein